MNNPTKFSISNVTIDSDIHRAHQCPSCRCLSPRNRPTSPHAKPFQRKTNIYYQNNQNLNNNCLFTKNISPSLRPQTPDICIRPISPKPKITIKYTSPQKQRKSQHLQRRRQKEQIKRPYSPYEKSPRVIPQTHISTSNIMMEIQEQPKKPSILNRHNSGNLPRKKNIKVSTTKNYYKQTDQKQVAQTIIKQLNLNYDYLTVNEVSDISADVSL